MGHRLGLACVAVMMVLLPVAYVTFCLAVAYGIFHYGATHTEWIALQPFGFILYLGPIIVGCVGWVFLVKPLFSLSNTINATLAVTPEKEPELFRFIEEVCERVGVRKPAKVLLDGQVKVSVGFEEGWWALVANRPVLTIGMPLAEGLTISQLGGALAHQLGPFRHPVAMRCTTLIRWTNAWLDRVVFDRNSWDRTLTAWAQGDLIFGKVIAWIALGLGWVARRILEGLMRTGHFLSTKVMRRMEQNAAQDEREVAGMRNLRESLLRRRLIRAGMQLATDHLNELWKGGRLVDNFPALAGEMFRSIPDSQAMSLDDPSLAHPTRADEGILIGEASAQELFADFESTAQAITLVDYKKRYKFPFKPEALVPTAAYLEGLEERKAKLENMNAFFGGLLADHRLIFPLKPSGLVAIYLDELRAEYDMRADRFAAQQSLAAALYDKIEAGRSRRATILTGDARSNLGIRGKPADYGLVDLKAATINAELAKCAAEIAEGRAALAPLLQLAREKLYLGCLLARSNWAAESPEKVERIEELEAFLAAIQPISQILNEHRKGFFLATVYRENLPAAKNKAAAAKFFEGQAGRILEALHGIEERAKFIHYPLRDGKKPAHLWGFLITGYELEGSVGRYRAQRSIYERINFLYIEVMLELLDAMAERGGILAPEEKLIEA